MSQGVNKMGSQGQYFTDIYAKTHEDRLKESIDTARKELVDRYGANATYLKYLDGELALYEQELTKVQGALADYAKARGGKSGPASADDTAKLLGVMTDAGNTIGRETGEAAQRKLDAEAAVEGRYRLSGEQSNAVGRAGDYFGKVDMTTAKTSADVQRIIDAAINEIGPGTFASGTDASKAGTAELYSRIDRALSRNSVYAADPSLKTYVAGKVAAKMGTNTSYISRAAVDADKTSAIDAAKTEVGVTGTGTSARAAVLAEQALSGKLGGLSDAEKKAVMDWMKSPAGNSYISAIDSGATQDEAILAAAGNLEGTSGKSLEEIKGIIFKLPSGDDIRAKVRVEGVSFDAAKYFDPAWTGLNARSKGTERKLGEIRTDRSGAIQKLGDVPTEEQARRRGVEIYEPIMPGVGARAREAQVRTEEAGQEGLMARSRPGARKGETIDDFLASRMARETAPLSDSQRVLAGASAAAVRNGPMAEKTGDWDATNDPAFRMYNNVREKQLRDTSPDALVRYASDLAKGDAVKRDDILREYYQWSLKEKNDLAPAKFKESVEKAEKPPGPVDIANIKSEDLSF
ncbi:hypothetical protein UFOVP390_38 [uncultured Caudovirales phage]|uniref:Uncharacterized protein n=1 Tax=uncultured Caudovirales phage TaxID=2100421 RepID=A0A6J7X512_9CAUD|nr:hypothetical protein UFOVP390_38 [uncultured Caudovirales phage]